MSHSARACAMVRGGSSLMSMPANLAPERQGRLGEYPWITTSPTPLNDAHLGDFLIDRCTDFSHFSARLVSLGESLHQWFRTR